MDIPEPLWANKIARYFRFASDEETAAVFGCDSVGGDGRVGQRSEEQDTGKRSAPNEFTSDEEF